MEDEELAQLLLASFVEELEGHQRALSRDALAVENAEPDERRRLFDQLFRTVHTIKGAARAAALGTVERACHTVEDLLQPLAQGSASLEPSDVETLLGFADVLDRTRQALAEYGKLEGTHVEQELLSLADGPPSRGAFQAPPSEEERVESEPRPMPPTAAVPSNPRESGEALRVTLGQADALLTLASDLDARISQTLSAARHLAESGASEQALAKLFAEVRRTSGVSHAMLDTVKRVRQVTFSEACRGLDRFVRDASRQTGHLAVLIIRGGNVHIDREIVRALREVLVQLVKNAIDHGGQPPEQRLAMGKSGHMTIEVGMRSRASDFVVTVTDDGRGFDVDGLRRELARKVGGAALETATDDEIARMAFHSGVSTAAEVTDLSGRGVGLDIVRARIEELRGSVGIQQRPNAGTTVTLYVPLLRASLRVLLVRASSYKVAIPTTAVESVERVRRDDLVMVSGRWSVKTKKGPLPMASLGSIVFPSVVQPQSEEESAFVSLVILSSHGRSAAVVVDELVDECNVLVTTLPKRLEGARLISGVLSLRDGETALTVNAAELVDRAAGAVLDGALVGRDERAQARQPRILLVDDSLTTRTLEKSILVAAGYSVITASDGEEAWELLRSQSFDALVSDVEMPRLDGFALTERVRRSPRLQHLPVLLVTGRASESDRRRGLDAGANGYIVKRAFDQQHLLEALKRLA